MYLENHIHWYTLKEFVEPLKKEFFIDNNIDIYRNNFKELMESNNALLLNGLYDRYPTLKESLIKDYSVSYRPHKNGWKFEYSPVHFIYVLMKKLGINTRIPFYNLDNKIELEKCKKDIKNEIAYNYHLLKKDFIDDGSLTSKNIISYLNILHETYINIDKIFEFRNYDIEDTIIKKSKVHPKDFLFYIASKSLILLDNYEEEICNVIPQKYANEIMEINSGELYPNTPFPHTICIGKKYMTIDRFADEYKNLQITKKGLFVMKNHFKLSVKEFIGDFEIIKSGHIKKEINEKNEMIKRMNRFRDENYIKLFEAKSNFYDNSGFVYLIKGMYDLQGYFTYGYSNDNLISDRLYSSEEKGSILTHSEGFYVIPADRFDLIKSDKQTIRETKKTDSRIHNHNHDTNKNGIDNPEYRWIEKAKSYINCKSCSTKSIDDVIVEEEAKQKIKAL